MRDKIPIDSLKFEVEDHDDGTSSCRVSITLGAEYRAFLRHRRDDGHRSLRSIVMDELQDHITGDIAEALHAYSGAVHKTLCDLRPAADPRRIDVHQLMEMERAMGEAYEALLKTLEIYK